MTDLETWKVVNESSQVLLTQAHSFKVRNMPLQRHKGKAKKHYFEEKKTSFVDQRLDV